MAVGDIAGVVGDLGLLGMTKVGLGNEIFNYSITDSTFLMFQLMDYPLEVPMIIASLLNPIDLSRIVILLQLDISVLMGATSAVFKDFLGTNWGIACALATLLTWAFLPLWLSNRKFNRKDL